MHTTKQIISGVFSAFFILIAAFSLAQKKEKMEDEGNRVKVKVMKIVNGDTTMTEKTMDETSVQDFTRQFENITGKNVQVIITVEDTHQDRKVKHKSSQAMHFNFDMDSSTASSFARAFSFSDSAICKKIVWNDNLMKNLPEDFDLKFDFDEDGLMNDFSFDFNIDTDKDGKTVIIKNGKGKTIVINGEEGDNASVSKSKSGNSRTKTKAIVINDDKTNTKKKMIISASVMVIDMDDEKENPDNRTLKEESSFSFYPNPSDGNFVLDFDMNEKEDALVKITDMNGKEVYNEKVMGNGKVSKAINFHGKKGTFIVTIKQGKRTSSKKIIIE